MARDIGGHITMSIDSAGKKGLLALVGLSFVLGTLYTTTIGFASTAASRADDPRVAEFIAELGPADPRAHYTLAVLLEKTFLPADLERSLAAYEQAASLSPHDYNYWIELGRARERSGDSQGAERSLRRAAELAPNYARVHWTLGNLLVREDRTDEGFAEIRRAVAADPTYTDPAASMAWQVLDGDLDRVRSVVGDSPRLNASLALLLASRSRYDESIAVWDSIPTEARTGDLKESGQKLAAKMLEAKRYRSARAIYAAAGGEAPGIGEVVNGDFESSLKLQGAGPFEWQIAPGADPQIAPTSGRKKSGGTSLVMIFGSSGSDLKFPTQIVPVEPGRSYELEVYYLADLKGTSQLKWAVIDTTTGKHLATTDVIAGTAEWTPLRAGFTVPGSSDGVTITVVREGCTGVCPLSGNVWFDDVIIKPAG